MEGLKAETETEGWAGASGMDQSARRIQQRRARGPVSAGGLRGVRMTSAEGRETEMGRPGHPDGGPGTQKAVGSGERGCPRNNTSVSPRPEGFGFLGPFSSYFQLITTVESV